MSRQSSEGHASNPSAKKGLLWMFSSQGSLSILQIVVLMTLARLLSPLDYGLATVFIAVTQIVSIVATMGAATTLVQRPKLEAHHVTAALSIAVAAGTLLGISLFLLREPLASILRLDGREEEFWILVPMCSVTAVHLVVRALMQRTHRFREMSLTETLSYLLLYSATAIYLATNGWGGLSLLIAYVLNIGCNTLVYFSITRPRLVPFPRWRSVKELGQTGVGFGLTELVGVISQNIDKILLSSLLGTAAVGVYGRAHSLMQTGLNMLTSPLDAVMFPAFSRAQDNAMQFQLLLRKTLILSSLLLLPGVLLMICTPTEIVLTLLGPDWTAAIPLLQVFGLLIWIRANGRAIDFVLRAKGKAYRRLALVAVYSALTAGFITVGSHHGLVGVALGVSAAFLIHAVLLTHVAIGLLGFGWSEIVRLLLFPLVWATPVGIATWLLLQVEILNALPAPIRLLFAGAWVATCLAFSIWRCPVLIFGRYGELARESITEVLLPFLTRARSKFNLNHAPTPRP